MSPATPARAKLEETRLLRRLAALVAQCRQDAIASKTSIGVEEQLSNVLFLFALKLIEQWQRQSLLCLPAKRDFLSSGGSALHAHWRKFAPQSECLPLPSPESSVVSLVWPKLGADDLLPLWSSPCLLGYVYQYFFLSERKLSQRAIQTANKELDREQIIAFTQLYTPAWVVDFLLDKTLSPALAQPVMTVGKDQPITVLDPACGCGHFLIPAFDMLVEHYGNIGEVPEKGRTACAGRTLRCRYRCRRTVSAFLELVAPACALNRCLPW